jgi:hypothetical protein
LRNKGADIADREPISETLTPYKSVFINSAVNPSFTKDWEGAWAARGAHSVSVQKEKIK